jgi:4-alpha-glucanotransferase
MHLDPQKKIAGILVPLFALRGKHDLGVGDIEALSEVIEWAAGNGFRAVQILPINETGGDHSPYNVLSALALDSSTITTHPSWLPELTPGDYRLIVERYDLGALRQGAVSYGPVKSLKRELLEAAWKRFCQGDGRSGRSKLFTHFLEQHAAWLGDYTLYRTLLERQNGLEDLSGWPASQRTATLARAWMADLTSRERAALEERRLFFAFVQWIAFSQWASVADLAEALGVALVGDVPVGVSAGGADIFAVPEEFDTGRSSGAPPEKVFKSDPFTVQWGQNWGFPLYNWEIMARNNFAWWRRRIRVQRSIFHMLRVDHALGFFRIYSFPWPPQRNAEFIDLPEAEAAARTGGKLPCFVDCDDDTPEHRAHNQRHGEVLLGMLDQEIGSHRTIAEDLGEVAPYVRPVMEQMGLPGFKIPIWERFPDGTMRPGSSYNRISVATYATHDHPPLITLWEEWQAGVLRGGEEGAGCLRALRELLEFAGRADLDPMAPFQGAVHEALLEGLLGCNSWIAVPIITDLFGSNQRFNVPGAVGSANWTARIEGPVADWNTRYKSLLAWWREAVTRHGRI